MKRAKLSEVAQINPRLPKGLDEAQPVSFLSMASVSETGKVLFQETRKLAETKKGYTYFQRDDILLAKITPCFENGKATHVSNLEHPIGFGSTEFHVLRPDPERLDAKYLFFLVWNRRLRYLGQKAMKGAAGHKRVPIEFLANYDIPLPPLDDQKRIAYLLGKVDGLIAQRKQHLQQLDDLLESVFFEMFGNLFLNEKNYDVLAIDEIKAEGRGTFSNGPFGSDLLTSELSETDGVPVIYIRDIRGATLQWLSNVYVTEDKARSLENCRVTIGDILVAKVGDPPGIAAVNYQFDNAIITQDVIRLRPNPSMAHPRFVQSLLNTHFGKWLVRKITIKGTRSRFPLKAFKELRIPVPSMALQNKFAAIVEKVHAIKARYQESLSDLEGLYGALSQKAFQGELDLSRVSLQSITSKVKVQDEVVAVVSDNAREAQHLPIHLPDVENMTEGLGTIEGRQRILYHWLEAYLAQLKGEAFSLNDFLEAAQTRLSELHPDNDFDLSLAEYEQVKDWLFQALASGRLEQTYDDPGNRVQLITARG